MPEAVIVDAVRTPIGRAFKGSLAQLRPDEMGAFVVDALLERNPEVDPELIEEVYCGVGCPQGLQGFNLGRIIALLSERLPLGTNGTTVSRYCASSLESIRQAANAVRAGQGDAYIAAGVEWSRATTRPSRERGRRTRTRGSRARTATPTPTSRWA